MLTFFGAALPLAPRTSFDDSPVNGAVIHLHPPFLHEFCAMARAQRVRYIPSAGRGRARWAVAIAATRRGGA